MCSMRAYFISALLLGCALLSPATRARACSAPPPASGHGLVASADVIVLATAVEFVAGQGVRFQVAEVLKGENVPTALVFQGSLGQRDDFNDRPVPYDFVRPGGRGGPCHAYEYKQGAEFLLLLKKRKAELTPYWAALAATNEQLRSADDPWLAWVRDHLRWLETASEVERLQLGFEGMKKGGFDTDFDLLWGYRFVDPDEEKLRRLGAHLEALGFRSAGVSRADEDEAGNYILRVEKVERHSPTTLARRNQEFRVLAATYGVKSYSGSVASKVK